MNDNPYTPYVTCDTPGCERASTQIVSGGFHFCDLHINDKAGRNDKRVSLTLRLPEPTWERLREQAHVERTTITALILSALERDYYEYGGPNVR